MILVVTILLLTQQKFILLITKANYDHNLFTLNSFSRGQLAAPKPPSNTNNFFEIIINFQNSTMWHLMKQQISENDDDENINYP